VIKQAVAYYLGIDGGGTKTTCVAGDENTLLARAATGPSNVIRAGEQAARAALHQSILEACAKSGISPNQVTCMVAGVAGIGRPEIRDFIQTALLEVVSGEITVVTDAAIALYAAFADGPGVVVIAGTGSIALAQDGQGNSARTGGWGWAISDEGSAPWIGRAAVAGILRVGDAGEAQEIEQYILRAWQLADRDQLILAANTIPPPNFGALLSEIDAAASAGDTLARSIFVQAAAELTRLAHLAANRLFTPDAAIPVAQSGGAFAHAPNLRVAFRRSLLTRLPNAILLPDLADPALGALQMARAKSQTPPQDD
jgi:glucosamine kinase